MRLAHLQEGFRKSPGQRQKLLSLPGRRLTLQPFDGLGTHLVLEHRGGLESGQKQSARVLEELIDKQPHVDAERN